MTALQWLAVGGLGLVLLMAAVFAYGMRYALNTISQWEDDE